MGNDVAEKPTYLPLTWAEMDDGWVAYSTVYEAGKSYFHIRKFLDPVRVMGPHGAPMHEGRYNLSLSSPGLIPKEWDGVLWEELDDVKKWCEIWNKSSFEHEHGE